MNDKSRVLIFCIFLTGAKTLLATCPDIRLDQNEGPFEKMKVWTQPCDLGVCYAVTSAQMIDAWLIKNNLVAKTFRSAVIPLAVAASIYTKKSNLEYAHTETVFKAVNSLRRMPCNQEHFHQKGQKLAKGGFSSLQKYIVDSLPPSLVNEIDRPDLMTRLSNAIDHAFVNLAKISPKYRQFLRDSLATDSPAISFLNNIVVDQCSDISVNILLPLPNLAIIHRQFNENFSAEIARALELNKDTPIGISYCGRVLNDKKYSLLDPLGRTVPGEPCGNLDKEMHASVIVGSRPQVEDARKCDFLIRDSAGPECKADRPWQCINGQYWISQDALKNNAIRAYYFSR